MKKWMIFATIAVCLCLIVLTVMFIGNFAGAHMFGGQQTEPTQETITAPDQEGVPDVTQPPLEGVCGDNATWSLSANKTVLTISGSGDMYACDPQPWEPYVLEIKEIIVEAGITSIGDCAFKGCAFVTTASIPETIVKIGKNAFDGCLDLNGMQIPAGVTEIGARAFNQCSSLENIKIPEGVTTLEYQVFYNCRGMKEIDIPVGVTTIKRGAFEQCIFLGKVNFLGDAPSMEENAFYMAPAKGYYEYSNKTWTQDIVQMYERILPLEALNVPPPPRSGTFGRSNIMEWKLENGTLYITGNGYMDGFFVLDKDMPWYPYREQVQAVVLTGNMQNIYSGAFVDCVNLKSVTFPDGLETIFDHVFAGCTGLEEIQIPDSVTQIMDAAFDHCTSLKSVKLPKNLRVLGMRSFESCESLETIELPSKLVIISTGAFAASGLKEIKIPASVEEIGESAFSLCTKLEKVTFLGSKIKKVERFTFQSCEILKSITLPASIKSIEWDAFECCHNLTAIYFRGNMPTLDTHFWMEVTLYYPAGNKTWTSAKIAEYQETHQGHEEFKPYNP